MKKLLIITQKVDESDDLLGFFVSWIKEFENHFDRVDVIALEPGISKFRQVIRVIRLLWRLTPTDGAVFCHMSPIFAVIAWPFAVLRHARLGLWYLHRSTTLRLRLAVALSDIVFTADTRSLTIKNKKIIAVGHGIDTGHFAVARDWSAISQRPLRVVSVGRLSPIKDFATLIRAAALLRDRQVPVEVRIVGRAVMPSDFAYQHELQALAARLAVQDIVHFVGFVPYKDIAEQYFWADVAVGCTPRGGIDKVLLEAMAAGCPVFTSNTVMSQYLEPYADQLVFQHGNPEDLAAKIESLDDHAAISATMVANVRRDHDLPATIAKISKLL